MKHKFYWRLERPYAIIYWSFAYSFLFLALILTLEKAYFNWRGLLALVVFFFFLLINRQRYIQFEDNKLTLSYGKFWNKQIFVYQECSKMEVYADALLIYHQQQKVLLFFKEKEKNKLLPILVTVYCGEIVYHENKYQL